MLEFKLVSKAHKYYHLLPWQFTTHPRKVVFPSRANMNHASRAADGISSLQFLRSALHGAQFILGSKCVSFCDRSHGDIVLITRWERCLKGEFLVERQVCSKQKDQCPGPSLQGVSRECGCRSAVSEHEREVCWRCLCLLIFIEQHIYPVARAARAPPNLCFNKTLRVQG